MPAEEFAEAANIFNPDQVIKVLPAVGKVFAQVTVYGDPTGFKFVIQYIGDQCCAATAAGGCFSSFFPGILPPVYSFRLNTWIVR